MSISKINIFFKVSVNKIWVSFLLKVYMAFAFALPLTSFCVHFNPVILWLQWLWWWPYSTMTIRCVVFDIPHPRRFCFDKTQTWHEIPDFHRWTTDFKYLTACAQGSPGFQGERRGDRPSPTEYKGLTIKKLTAN